MAESMTQRDADADWLCGECGTRATERPGRVNVNQYTIRADAAPPQPVPYCHNPRCRFFDAIIPNYKF